MENGFNLLALNPSRAHIVCYKLDVYKLEKDVCVFFPRVMCAWVVLTLD